MKRLTESAYAKINLTLDVCGLRPDGYHDLEMVMQSVSLCDRLTLTLREEAGIVLESDREDLPRDRKNLAVDAAHRLLEAAGREAQGLSIAIDKRIPVCAGTAGGSSDAAAVLRGLNRLMGEPFTVAELCRLGEQVGSDVPYCVLGETVLAEGKGEQLTHLAKMPDCAIVLCKPDFSVSTPWLFGRIDAHPPQARPDTAGMRKALESGDLAQIAGKLCNVFEEALPEAERQEISQIKERLCAMGALSACMTGTGSTVFGIFPDEATAAQAMAKLRESYKEVFLTRPV